MLHAGKSLRVTPDELRTETIKAIFADSVASQVVVLKGGNALRLVYGQPRTSIDIDFSLRPQFEEHVLQSHLESSIKNHFRASGYEVVSFDFRGKPKKGPKKFGYELVFRVLEERVYRKNAGDPGVLRVLASDHRNAVEMEFSKDEYLGSLQEVDWDVQVVVYTREAIVIEKLRALCQQMPEFEPRKGKAARSRDLYDICYALDDGLDLTTAECGQTARAVFAAKDVPLDLLLRLESEREREHHRVDWPAVVQTVPAAGLLSYEAYFDRVSALAKDLHARWNV